MRGMRLVLALLFVFACHNETSPAHPNPGDHPPLPPASGTPIGYLLDSQSDLKLRDEQIKKLQELDASLAARDAEIDTQLRAIEKPEQEEPTPKGQQPKRRNMAPGSSGPPQGDAAKLHAMRDSNDRDALKKAWAILDKDQQEAAAKILGDHDVESPGHHKQAGSATTDEGQPLPGMEP